MLPPQIKDYHCRNCGSLICSCGSFTQPPNLNRFMLCTACTKDKADKEADVLLAVAMADMRLFFMEIYRIVARLEIEGYGMDTFHKRLDTAYYERFNIAKEEE